jgi:transposase-like protein
MQLDKTERELDEALGRMRVTAQTLIEEVGASGPANAEDVAVAAVAEIARLREQLDEVTRERDALKTARAHRYCPKCFVKDAEITRLRALLARLVETYDQFDTSTWKGALAEAWKEGQG